MSVLYGRCTVYGGCTVGVCSVWYSVRRCTVDVGSGITVFDPLYIRRLVSGCHSMTRTSSRKRITGSQSCNEPSATASVSAVSGPVTSV